jgi:hypothetical protein
MRPHPDRLLFFDDNEGPGVRPPARPESRPRTVGAALFLLGIVVGLAGMLYFLVGWHVARMH